MKDPQRLPLNGKSIEPSSAIVRRSKSEAPPPTPRCRLHGSCVASIIGLTRLSGWRQLILATGQSVHATFIQTLFLKTLIQAKIAVSEVGLALPLNITGLAYESAFIQTFPSDSMQHKMNTSSSSNGRPNNQSYRNSFRWSTGISNLTRVVPNGHSFDWIMMYITTTDARLSRSYLKHIHHMEISSCHNISEMLFNMNCFKAAKRRNVTSNVRIPANRSLLCIAAWTFVNWHHPKYGPRG